MVLSLAMPNQYCKKVCIELWHFGATNPLPLWSQNTERYDHKIKTHCSVSCGPRKRTCANGVSILTGTTKLQFLHIRSSMVPYPNGNKFTVELAYIQVSPHSKFGTNQQIFVKFLNFRSFFLLHCFVCTLLKNRCNSHMCVPIWLKFRTRIGGL